MRILYVSHSFPPPHNKNLNTGGMQRVAVDIYDALKAHENVKVVPLLLETAWNTTHLKAPFFLASLFWKIPKLVKKHEIEAIFFSAIVTGWITFFIKKRLQKSGVKSFVMLHGREILLPNKIYQWALPKLLAKVDVFFPNSTATCEAALTRNFPKERTFVVPIGIDIHRMKKTHLKENAKTHLLTQYKSDIENPFILLSIGRHVKRKGFVWFTENVMPLLPANVVYWVGGDGQERAHLEAVIQQKQLQHRVKILGHVSDEHLTDLYQGADLYVMPNIYVPGDMEGFGIVLLEAGVLGLPAIAAGIEGIRDVVHEGKNGHLLPSEDAEAFVKTILHYVENPEALAKLSASTQNYVPQNFSWQGIAHQYVTLMQKA